MKNPRSLYFIGLLILGALLSGCMGTVITPPVSVEPPVIPIDYSIDGEANYVPPLPGEDLYPLFVGARWLYRNAANYWNPQIASSGLLESEVVAIVQGKGVQCYVLRTRYSNGPDELLYLHRTSSSVSLCGSAVIPAAGAQPSFSLDPGLTFLEFPFYEDRSWLLETVGGRGQATVFHEEVAAIEAGTVNTLHGSLPAIFPGSWRVHFELPEYGPRFYGGPVQFLWFAEGVGVVKHVLNSVDYELAETRLRDEVLSLTEDDARSTTGVELETIITVQLRGPEEGWGWKLENSLGVGAALEAIGGYFYPDTPNADSDAGTQVFQFRAVHSGLIRLEFAPSIEFVAEPVEFTILVE